MKKVMVEEEEQEEKDRVIGGEEFLPHRHETGKMAIVGRIEWKKKKRMLVTENSTGGGCWKLYEQLFNCVSQLKYIFI